MISNWGRDQTTSAQRDSRKFHLNVSQFGESNINFSNHENKRSILLQYDKTLQNVSALLIKRYALLARINEEDHEHSLRSPQIPLRNSKRYILDHHLELISKQIVDLREEASCLMSSLRLQLSPENGFNTSEGSQNKKRQIISNYERGVVKPSSQGELDEAESFMIPRPDNSVKKHFEIQSENFKKTKTNNDRDSSNSDCNPEMVSLEKTDQDASMASSGNSSNNLTPLSFSEIFTIRIAQLKEYKNKHGDLNVPCKYDQLPELGDWVSARRKRYKLIKCGKASPTSIVQERNKILTDMDFVWDANEWMWENIYKKIKQFKEEHGHLRVPRTPKGSKALCDWIHTQRFEYRKFLIKKRSQLTEDRVRKLNELDFIWDSAISFWEKKYDELQTYKKEHGTINVKWKKEVRALAEWAAKQRKECNKLMLGEKSYLADDQIEKLRKIGFFDTQKMDVLKRTMGN